MPGGTTSRASRARPSADEEKKWRGGAAGGRGSTRPAPRLRVGSQGGMPTRSSPEAGLAGDESYEASPCTFSLRPDLRVESILMHPDPPCQPRELKRIQDIRAEAGAIVS